MRFRSTFPLPLRLQIVTAILWTANAVLSHRRHTLQTLMAIFYLILFVFGLCAYFFSYWEILPEGLMERRFRTTRTIPFRDILRVYPTDPRDSPREGRISVDYGSAGPLSPGGTLTFSPAHAQRLLDLLEAAAPHARFESSRLSDIPVLSA